MTISDNWFDILEVKSEPLVLVNKPTINLVWFDALLFVTLLTIRFYDDEYSKEFSTLVGNQKDDCLDVGKKLLGRGAKSFDNSAVFSEFAGFDGRILDLRMELYKNGSLVLNADRDLMLNKPNRILSEINSFLSLEDGDLT